MAVYTFFSIKGKLAFCGSFHPSYLCFVMPHHDSRQTEALHTALQPTEESEVAACLLALLNGTGTTCPHCCQSCFGLQWPIHRGERSY